jgi:penicillin-binding protein-related factor A (putative recombinase)
MNKDWKKAQDNVSKVLKSFMDVRKDFYFKRFTDTYEAGNIVQNQPSDFWFIHKGIFTICEVKSSNYTDKFYVKDIRPSQFIGARRVTAAGGKSLFLIVKLPEWQWHRIDGMLLWSCKDNGIPGVAWDGMEQIKLTAEEILR